MDPLTAVLVFLSLSLGVVNHSKISAPVQSPEVLKAMQEMKL